MSETELATHPWCDWLCVQAAFVFVSSLETTTSPTVSASRGL